MCVHQYTRVTYFVMFNNSTPTILNHVLTIRKPNTRHALHIRHVILLS